MHLKVQSRQSENGSGSPQAHHVPSSKTYLQIGTGPLTWIPTPLGFRLMTHIIRSCHWVFRSLGMKAMDPNVDLDFIRAHRANPN